MINALSPSAQSELAAASAMIRVLARTPGATVGVFAPTLIRAATLAQRLTDRRCGPRGYIRVRNGSMVRLFSPGAPLRGHRLDGLWIHDLPAPSDWPLWIDQDAVVVSSTGRPS